MMIEPPQGTPCLRGRVAIPWDDITGVKTLLAQGKTRREIANIFGVSRRTIDRVIRLNDPVRQTQTEEYYETNETMHLRRM